MTKSITFPCDNCVCVPVCRHKDYRDLFTHCALLGRSISSENETIQEGNNVYTTIDIINKNTTKFRYLLYAYLNPTRWKVETDGHLTIVEGR